ncbi:efflux RND transporter periplasmic adaptor subunit, partial [Limnobacter sp.]|uniref:efflux RND transporter periplasmic adaptor subunit n=1 Tax=Limnobacter sp. TaxID=2003368 RepID=UPI00351519A8
MLGKKFWLVLLSLCMGSVAAYLVYAANTGPALMAGKSGKPSMAPKVLVQQVAQSQTANQFETTATAWAQRSAEIYPNVEEEVVSVHFKAQQKVKRGQVLVQQDDREQQLALKLAMVQLASTKSLLERYQQAVQKGAVPQSQVETAQADHEAAKVAVEQAKLNIEYRKIRAPFDGVVGIPDVDPGQRVGPSVLIT